MNFLEFIVAVLLIIVVGMWGLAYLAYKYASVEQKDDETKNKSKDKKSK